jgi:transcriptional regulator with PAS, ATPase and Fis domain
MKKLDNTEQSGGKIPVREETERSRTLETNGKLDEVKLFARKQIEGIMGKGKVISDVFRRIETYAKQDCSLLIEGETGVGKKEIVTYLHSISPRRNYKLVIIDCGAISESLIETELFGCIKGAYTDAKIDKKGKIEIANGGILFLDEINSLSIDLQKKLLRVIQEKEITRVGDTKPIKVDVRIIAAGNENFRDLVRNKRFRRDLYERFVDTIRIPTLEERAEDMDFFIDKFIEEKSNELGKQGVRIDKEARKMLKNHQWEGNVRELIHFIHKLVSFVEQENGAKTYIISPELLREYCLPESLITKEETNDNEHLSWETALNITRKNIIEQALKETKGNHEEAIKLLKMSRSSYFEWKKKLGIV